MLDRIVDKLTGAVVATKVMTRKQIVEFFD
jgi:hypothetical protein